MNPLLSIKKFIWAYFSLLLGESSSSFHSNSISVFSFGSSEMVVSLSVTYVIAEETLFNLISLTGAGALLTPKVYCLGPANIDFYLLTST